MSKKHIRTVTYIGLFVMTILGVISCEEDFTDIGTSIVSNNAFSTGDTIMEVEVSTEDLANVRGDALEFTNAGLGIFGGGTLGLTSRTLGQYLLGVYNNSDYEKIEASIISQLGIPDEIEVESFQSDTTVVTTVDAVLLRIPYQSTLTENTSNGPTYTLDSIIGNREADFTLNVFRLSAFLNSLDPNDPTQQKEYGSDYTYPIFTEKLGETEDLQFRPSAIDTMQVVERRLSTGELYLSDTIKYDNVNPFITIRLKKDRIKELFIDQYETENFSSQEAFNNYFRGLEIRAEGNDGSLISLDLNNSTLPATLDIYYTKTVSKSGVGVIDTIQKTDVFTLSEDSGTSNFQIRNNIFRMSPANAHATNNMPVQGTAGKVALIDLFGQDNNGNGVPDGLDELKDKEVLINDATLTFFVDQNIVGDNTTSTPFRLYLYKDYTENNEKVRSKVLDAITEDTFFGGGLVLDDEGKPDYYSFKITDYISELVSGTRDDFTTLGLKVAGPTDFLSDTLVRPYSWNPKAVMLLNHDPANAERRAKLVISYSKKK